MFNKKRNKALEKQYLNEKAFYNSDNDYVEIKLLSGKDNNNYIISHIRYSNEDGSLSYRGNYFIFNNRNERIGSIKYVLFDDSEPVFMQLSDIFLEEKYRNTGIGTKAIALFEGRAKEYGAHYIEGELSSVDERTEKDTELRNQFYIKRGYEIKKSKVYKPLI